MTIYPGGPQDSIKYVATAPDGSRCAFNDPTDADYVGMARFSGLDSSDIREAINNRSGTDGATQGLNFRGSRPVVGSIEILGTTTADRNTKWAKMKRALNALRADGTLAFTPDGGLPSQVKFRLNTPIRKGDEPGWLHKAQFGLQCADPYIYSQSAHATTVSASPWSATITNQGDGLAAPTFSVAVAVAGQVALTNVTTGLAVYLNNVDPAIGAFGSYVLTFAPGTVGPNNGQLSAPTAAVVDGSGNVFVADASNNRIQKFNSSGVYQSQFGSAGNGDGQFNDPRGMAIDGAGKIWVVDRVNHRIQRFSAAGAFETKFGSFGTGDGQFKYPEDIAIDGAGNIFVTDPGNSRVQKLTAGTPPTFASKVGTAGTGNGQFGVATRGIVVDSGGTNFWVVDAGNNRVQKFTNASPPVYVSQFSLQGVAPNASSTITRDSSNNLYVAAPYDKVLRKFNSTGTLLSSYGSFGSGPGQFQRPWGVAMLGSGTTPLYAVDNALSTVQKIDTSGFALALDFSIASVRQAGLNAYNLVDVPSSAWWALAPGDNLISVTGGSAWTINWRDAWL